ncbi:MAG: DUF4832 domain-containing protein [Planctomycetota bacterium]|nr:DUF4832 domain-containing protein [Planctomycetota bacterium]
MPTRLTGLTLALGAALLSAAAARGSDAPGKDDAIKQLAAQMAEALKAGEKPKVWAEVFGKKAEYPLKSADEKGFAVLVAGNAFGLEWAKLAPDDLVTVAKTFGAGHGKRLLTAAELAMALGQSDQALDLLAKVTEADPSLGDRVKAAAARIKDAPAAAPASSGSNEAAPGPAAGGKMVTVTPEEDATTPLRLPDAGLQTRMWSAPQDNYLMRANILYARFTWKDWGLDGKQKTGHFKGWMDKKRYVAFRMYCNTAEDLPTGVPTVTSEGKTIPAYWDPKFLEFHKKFVQGVAQEIGENPYLAYIDIGGVGNTGGEWLVYPDDRWGDKPVFDKVGYTEEAKDKLVWELMKMYREAFPHVRLYLACGGYGHCKDKAKLIEYMQQNNIGLRSDGLCWPSVDDADTWSVRKNGTHKLWENVPFQWEGSYSTMEWEKDGWKTDEIMKRALDFGPISFCYADADKDALRFEGDAAKVKILERTALKMGYRIAVAKASYYDTAAPGGTLELNLTLVNRGVSKIYADRNFEVALLDASGQVRGAASAKPMPSTRLWMPGQEIPVSLKVTLPKSVPSGEYKLAIAMLDEDPRRPNQALPMALKNGTAEHRYPLGSLKVTLRSR